MIPKTAANRMNFISDLLKNEKEHMLVISHIFLRDRHIAQPYFVTAWYIPAVKKCYFYRLSQPMAVKFKNDAY